MITSRKLFSLSVLLARFFPLFSFSLCICVARSKHRSVFDHALSKQMSYFLRRADEGDGTNDEANSELKRLKISYDCSTWR